MIIYTLLENNESSRDGFITVFRGNFDNVPQAQFYANNLLLGRNIKQYSRIYFTLLVTCLNAPSQTDYNSTLHGTVSINKIINAPIIKWTTEGLNNGTK